MHKPLISVLIPSFNHEKFIAATIQSVLAQTYRNIEVIVVDDASSDRSVSVVKSIRDERISLRQLADNVGACQAMNIGLSMCSGEYVAVCNSDDIWMPTKLEQQFSIFSNGANVGAVFSDVEWLDDSGNVLGEAEAPSFHAVFRQTNRSRFSWIKSLIESGNCLCHPSILIRREVYEKVGMYNNFYRQLPDLDMWLRVLQHYDILVMPEKLVGFRIHDNNTSRPSRTTSIRSINEHRLILVDLLRTISPENFYSAFGFENVESINDQTALRFEIAKYLLGYNGLYEKLFNQLGTELLLQIPHQELIRRGLTAHDFHILVGRNTPWISNLGPEDEENAQRDRPKTVAETRTIDLVRTVANRLRSRLTAT